MKKRKILVLSPYFPYPPRDGGKVRLYNLIKNLSLTNDVYLLSFIDSPGQANNAEGMKRFCKETFVVLRDESRRILGEALPRSISFFYTPEMISTLGKVIALVKPDVVQIEFLIMTQYLRHVKGTPAVYTEHDMSNIDFDQSFHDRDLPERERYAEWQKLVAFEKKILKEFDSVIVLTERDRRLLREFSPGTPSVLIPTGVDVDYFRPAGRSGEEHPPRLVYIGHYRHYPNYDAILYFLKDIFPRVLYEVPESTFSIVGSGMGRGFAELGNHRVSVIGEVEDVRIPLHAATVFVAPVRLGGGIKGKILEAMASGIPVVATEEASRGIAGDPGKDFLVARDGADFAAKVTLLLKDKGLRRAIALHGRALVERYYDWTKIAGDLDDFYRLLCAQPA